MRVLINTITAEGARSGIGHYTNELVRCLREQLGDGAVGTFPSAWVSRLRGGWSRGQQGVAPPSPRTAWGRLRALARRQAGPVARRAGKLLIALSFRRAVRGGHDLYHEPNFIPLEGGLPTVATVHDLSVLLHPQWHPAHRVGEFERQFLAGLRRCGHLLAISRFGRSEVVRHLGWPAERVSVTYMGVRPGLRRVGGEELKAALGALGLGEGYLLHVGTLEPRKNLGLLLRAYAALPAGLRARHPLVLAGGAGWGCGELHDYLRGPARHDNVRWLGYVEDRLFAALYSGARALAFPTLYEGFGLPAAEMLACGGAVLASTADAVAEVCGGRAHLVDPRDEAGWRDALLRACQEEDWCRALRRGAQEKAAGFTWENCAAATADAYRRVLADGAPTRRAA